MQTNKLEFKTCLLLSVTFTAELHSQDTKQSPVNPAPKHLISNPMDYFMAHDSMANLQSILQVEHQGIRCQQQT